VSAVRYPHRLVGIVGATRCGGSAREIGASTAASLPLRARAGGFVADYKGDGVPACFEALGRRGRRRARGRSRSHDCSFQVEPSCIYLVALGLG
jgi:hypothetical protein